MKGEYDYSEFRRVVYGKDGATFIPACPSCGRFVKADERAHFGNDGQPDRPNGTCSKCGRIQMIWEGYY